MKPFTKFLALLTSSLLLGSVALAQPDEAMAPVRAFVSGRGLVLVTRAAWLTAEISFPGQDLASITLGPSFDGARWLLPQGADGQRLELAWVGPDGVGSTLSMPLEASSALIGSGGLPVSDELTEDPAVVAP